MRTPVISRSVATFAAALTFTVGLPLLASAPAWACGDENPPTTEQAPERHAKDPVAGFIPVLPTSITAGGAPVEIGVEQANFTGEPYRRLAPRLALFSSADSSTEAHRLANLQPEQVKVEVMYHGAWKRLDVRHSCDPTLNVVTDPVAEPVADGRAHRYTFRVSLSVKAPKELKKIDVYGGMEDTNKVSHFTLDITRPKATAAPTTKAPTTPPATAPTPATVPAAVVSTPAATPSTQPTAAAAAAAELAQTGGGAHSGFLVGSAAACLALGAGVLYAVRRRARH